MRAANTYRASKRNEARALGVAWRGLDMIVLTTGERRVKYPLEKNGRKIAKENADGQ